MYLMTWKAIRTAKFSILFLVSELVDLPSLSAYVLWLLITFWYPLFFAFKVQLYMSTSNLEYILPNISRS